MKISDYVLSHLSQRFSCNNPLRLVDMVGIWKRLNNKLSLNSKIYGLCVYCGCLTQVSNEKMTNYGLSCLRHPTSDMPYYHPCRVNYEFKRRHLTKEKQKKCSFCNYMFTNRKFPVYNSEFKIEFIYLCSFDYKACKQLFVKKNIPHKKRVLRALNNRPNIF